MKYRLLNLLKKFVLMFRIPIHRGLFLPIWLREMQSIMPRLQESIDENRLGWSVSRLASSGETSLSTSVERFDFTPSCDPRNVERAGEIRELIDFAPNRADDILQNLELFDEVSGLILRFEEELKVIDSMFENIDEFAVFASVIDAHDGQHLDKMNSFIALSESHGFENLEVALQDPDSVEIFLEDPGFLKIASESPEYFDSLKKGPVDLSEVPSELALQLQDLQLAPEELHLVLADLIKGPAVDAPTSAPPDDSGADLSANVGLLSLIQDHQLVDTFDLELVVSSELAMASSFFEETIGAYDALLARS